MSRMNAMDKHFILIGFKHVGKSVIGQQLAVNIGRPFIDLDRQIEQLFKQTCQPSLSARQIMQNHGEAHFRQLEHQALVTTLAEKPSVIALGGGCPLALNNQILLKPHLLIYITAPPDKVFERIMASGQPAFFSSTKDPHATFNTLWQARAKIYQSLASFSVANQSSIEAAVLEIIETLQYHRILSRDLSEWDSSADDEAYHDL